MITEKEAVDIKKKFFAMPAKKRRAVAAEAFLEMQGVYGENLKKCPFCHDSFPEKDFVPLDGAKVCPRCVFVLALYSENKISKKITPGCLAPEKLNSTFRQILEEEYYLDPAGAYQKYLGRMLEEAEKLERIIRVKEDALARILSGWEFLLLSPQRAKSFQAKEGEEIILRPDQGGEEVKRKIYAIHKMPKKYALQYGAKTAVTVLYIPKEVA